MREEEIKATKRNKRIEAIKECIAPVIVICLIACVGVWLYKTDKAVDARRAERQVQIDTFYTVHNCRPEGYVAGKYAPIRTHRCDNGLYIAEDMR